jgi:hypothetical protein
MSTLDYVNTCMNSIWMVTLHIMVIIGFKFENLNLFKESTTIPVCMEATVTRNGGVVALLIWRHITRNGGSVAG